MKMNKKVIGWNINQRSGMGQGIPQFVIDELIAQNADIIVLTEVYKDSTIEYFFCEMEKAGYSYAISQNDGMNEVCILWKTSCYQMISVDDSVISRKDNNNPNLLLVDLEDIATKKILTVVGYRIRMADYAERVEELEIVMDKVSGKETPVLIVTDCNNLRRETIESTWNLNVVDDILAANDFIRHTPAGQSIYAEKAQGGYAYEFAEDHIITRGLSVALGAYDRSFVYRYPAAYPWGTDFQKYNEKTGRPESIAPGYPDHAIVKGYFRESNQED